MSSNTETLGDIATRLWSNEWTWMVAAAVLTGTALSLMITSLTKSVSNAHGTPSWSAIGGEIGKVTGINFAMLFFFYVVCILYFMQNDAWATRIMFLLAGLVFVLGYTGIALSAMLH